MKISTSAVTKFESANIAGSMNGCSRPEVTCSTKAQKPEITSPR